MRKSKLPTLASPRSFSKHPLLLRRRGEPPAPGCQADRGQTSHGSSWKVPHATKVQQTCSPPPGPGSTAAAGHCCERQSSLGSRRSRSTAIPLMNLSLLDGHLKAESSVEACWAIVWMKSPMCYFGAPNVPNIAAQSRLAVERPSGVFLDVLTGTRC